MTSWLDPLSPAIRSAVVSGAYGKAPHSDHANPLPVGDGIDTIADALARASDDLSVQTAHMFHPAMQVVEEFVAEPAARRLSTTFIPVRSIVDISAVRDGVLSALPLTGVYLHGGTIRFTDSDCTPGLALSTAAGRYLTMGGWWGAWLGGPWPRSVDELTVTYQCGSTITASARAAVLALAHQYWLKTSACSDCEECQLPERTTSVSREGLSFTVGDPLDPLSSGGTGLPDVDLWVRGVNPRRVLRTSGVYTPDAPPPVVVSTQALRNLVVTP